MPPPSTPGVTCNVSKSVPQAPPRTKQERRTYAVPPEMRQPRISNCLPQSRLRWSEKKLARTRHAPSFWTGETRSKQHLTFSPRNRTTRRERPIHPHSYKRAKRELGVMSLFTSSASLVHKRVKLNAALPPLSYRFEYPLSASRPSS